MIRLILSVITVVAISLGSPCQASPAISNYFKQKLDVVNAFLAKNHERALKQPELLVNFVDKELLYVWSAKNTLRAMLGPKRWGSIEPEQQGHLIQAYESTIRRYLYEVLQQYRGQTAVVESLRLNNKGNKGWLSVLLNSSDYPDLRVDLKIYNNGKVWTVYDFSFQGISFVKLKRVFFRQTFDQHGVDGLIQSLNKKNKTFKQMIAAE